MRKIFYVILFVPSLLFAQAGQWTWMKGANVADQKGNYGTLGVEASSNIPGARYESGGMRDNQNNFWLFGGSGYDDKGSLGILMDFWKYNTSTNNWTWINGDSSTLQSGVYGTQGVPSPTNKPGQRYAFVTWNELNGALWMWGGNSLNDLWKYDLSSNEWTWMTGTNGSGAIGVYGTKGMPAATNTPGARGEVTCSWTDSKGNLWMFGGAGNAATSSYGMLNDLWMYNPGTNMWTWVSGDNVINPTGVYGTLGVAAAGNKPGGRQPYNCWIDSQDNLWLFGGLNNSGFYYNDLWKYNITSGLWTWMSGSNVAVSGNTGANYGTQCVGDSLNIPSRRMENKANWVDSCGNLWTYGGEDVVGDLWVYSPSTHKWTWASGDNTINPTPVYGTQGVSNLANKPGARMGAPAWKNSDGSLWIFGGGYSSSVRGNDLWRYYIDTSCVACANNAIPPPTASFQASDTNLCANDCISFANQSTNATSWQWSFQGAMPPTSTDQSPQTVCYLSAGAFAVTLIASDAGGNDTLTLSNYIMVNASPAAPLITQSNDTLFCNTDSTYSSYQWYNDTTLIAGATDTLLVVSSNGNYNVKVTSGNNCSSATGINIILGIKQFALNADGFTVSPNPVSDLLTITTTRNPGIRNSKLIIYNVLGENIYQSAIDNQQTVIDVTPYPSGVYFIQVLGESERWIGRFVKSSSNKN